jgi:hypothetical protein
MPVGQVPKRPPSNQLDDDEGIMNRIERLRPDKREIPCSLDLGGNVISGMESKPGNYGLSIMSKVSQTIEI